MSMWVMILISIISDIADINAMEDIICFPYTNNPYSRQKICFLAGVLSSDFENQRKMQYNKY